MIYLLIFIVLTIVFYCIYRYSIVPVDNVTVKQYDNFIQIDKNDDTYHIDYEDIDYYETTQPEPEWNLFENAIELHVEHNNEVEDDIDIPEILQFDIDKQNVHDTLVQESIKKAHKNLVVPSNTEQLTCEEVYNQITRKYPELQNILRQIKKRNANVYNIDKTEMEVLTDVWNQAQMNKNIEDELVYQIKECANEIGMLYCPTGVITRFTSALNIENPENLPKTKGIYREEVLNKFNRVYKATGYDPDSRYNIRDIVIFEYKPLGEKVQEEIASIIDEFIEHV